MEIKHKKATDSQEIGCFFIGEGLDERGFAPCDCGFGSARFVSCDLCFENVGLHKSQICLF